MWSCVKVSFKGLSLIIALGKFDWADLFLPITRHQGLLRLANNPAIVSGQGICWRVRYLGIHAPKR